MVKVSVVIPNYNGEKYLRGCIESILNEAYKAFEVIIIDNASTDSSYAWLGDYENIIFKRLDQNYGFSTAVNEGIKLAKGEYVLLLNNDTVVEHGFIEALVKTIEVDDKIFGVASKMITYQDHNLMDDAGDEYTLFGWTLKRGDGQHVDYYIKPCKVFSVCAGAALYRKKVFDEIGLFDESFFAYMEDVDISFRSRIHGYYNVYCPDAKVYHIGSATSGSRYNDFKVNLAARNNIYVQYKNMPLLQLLINLPFLFTGCIIKYLWFCKKGYGKVYAKGVKQGMCTLSQIDKVPYNRRNLLNYFLIEGLIIKNTIMCLLDKIHKIMKK